MRVWHAVTDNMLESGGQILRLASTAGWLSTAPDQDDEGEQESQSARCKRPARTFLAARSLTLPC